MEETFELKKKNLDVKSILEPQNPSTTKCDNSRAYNSTFFTEKYLPRRKTNVKLKENKAYSLDIPNKNENILHSIKNSSSTSSKKSSPCEALIVTDDKIEKILVSKIESRIKVESLAEPHLLQDSNVSESKLETKESEKLQKRVNDLSHQMMLYEKKLLLLKDENENVLKKKSEESKAAEEKMKVLRRKNADLSSEVRKLEVQLKQIQQENALGSIMSTRKNSPTLERTSSSPLQQKIKSGDILASKEKTIQLLQSKYQQLINYLNSMNIEQNCEFNRNESHLESVIKVASKERLQLEKGIACDKKKTELQVSLRRCRELEKQVADLEKEMNSLQLYIGDKEKLEVEIVQKSIVLETVEKKLETFKSKVVTLEADLMSLRDLNMQMTVSNSDLQKQLEHSKEAEKVHSLLNEILKKTENEVKVSKEKIRNLEASIKTMTSQVEGFVGSENKRKLLEVELKNMKRERNEKEAQSESNEHLHKKTIGDLEMVNDHLKIKLAEVENEKVLLANEKKELIKELETLKSIIKNDIMTSDSQKSTSPDAHKHSSDEVDNKAPQPSELGNQESELSDLVRNYESTDDDGYLPRDTSHEDDTSADPSNMHIFQALYNYNPQQYSPNEQPNEELHLTAGDFLIIYGGMDEDGFYYGESIEGQKGFIPSNFVRKLSEIEKDEFFKIVNMDMFENFNHHSSLNTNTQALPPALRSELNGLYEDDMYLKNTFSSTDILPESNLLPEPPVSIHVDMTKDKSLIVSWLPVTIATHGMSNGIKVAGYCVYIDGIKVKVANNPTDDHIEIHQYEMRMREQPRYVAVRTLASNDTESFDSVPFFLSQSITGVISDIPSIGKGLFNSKIDEIKHESLQSLTDNEFNMGDRSWKNLPNRQSLDFQATQQFQALYRSASVNDAQPHVHESGKFNSDSGLLGDDKLNDLYDQTSKSLDVNLCNGNEGTYSSHHNHSLTEEIYPGIQNGGSRKENSIYSARIEACRKKIFPGMNDYRSIILTDNDVVTSINIRDDIPDGELIDYEDDAGESLLDNVCEDGERNRIRIFIALFSYDPVSMSPNPDAADVELKFREGQIIKIFGSKDEDGFFLGEAGGKRGLVPCNMVSEVEVDDPQVADELLKESNRQVMQSVLGMNSEMSSRAPSLPDDGHVQEESEQEVRYMGAIYNYDPLELSPNTNVEQELSFKRGDVIEIFGDADIDGFYYGRLDGKIGLVPSNFVTELEDHTCM